MDEKEVLESEFSAWVPGFEAGYGTLAWRIYLTLVYLTARLRYCTVLIPATVSTPAQIIQSPTPSGVSGDRFFCSRKF